MSLNPENQAVNSRVVCFNCHQKGHYANNCPSKPLRTATNMSGIEKPTMSREQRIAEQVKNLKNDEQSAVAAASAATGGIFGSLAGATPG